MHGHSMNLGRMTLVGVGGSNPTPFGTPFELTDKQIDDVLNSAMKKMEKSVHNILLCHAPPYGTLDKPAGEHVGSQSIRKHMKSFDLVCCAHIHESRGIMEVDGEPNVFVVINKQSGANTVLASRAVVEALPEIKRSAAADIDFKIVFNQADYINASLGNLSSTAMLGVGITFLVLLFFLRHVRSSLIVAASIPVSVIATFAVMDQAHMTLNILTMAGLALSIGMLVDNSIVVLENIFRLREEGMDAWSAAIEVSFGRQFCCMYCQRC
jgi:preprotein translocase subunit SecD